MNFIKINKQYINVFISIIIRIIWQQLWHKYKENKMQNIGNLLLKINSILFNVIWFVKIV